MHFIRQIFENRNLRKAVVKAMIVVGAAFFALRIVQDYIAQCGASFEPLLDGKFQVAPAFWWAVRDAVLGALSGLIGVYIGWKQDH